MDTVIVEHGSGAYLESYDPEAHNGAGEACWTHDLSRAMRFASRQDAHYLYSAQPTCRPFTDAGFPNRPLLYFPVEFVQVEAAA